VIARIKRATDFQAPRSLGGTTEQLVIRRSFFGFSSTRLVAKAELMIFEDSEVAASQRICQLSMM
jgi:hypothetical protein